MAMRFSTHLTREMAETLKDLSDWLSDPDGFEATEHEEYATKLAALMKKVEREECAGCGGWLMDGVCGDCGEGG